MTSVTVWSASSGSMGPKPATSWSTPSTRRWRSSLEMLSALLDDEAVHELADDAGQLAAYPGRVGEVDAWREGTHDLRLQAQPDLAEGLLAG